MSSHPDVLLLGHFPPPRGGVATHLDRLRAALVSSRLNAVMISFGRHNASHPETIIAWERPLALVSALLRGAGVLHYHTDEGDWKSAAIIGIWCRLRGQRYVMTFHSFRRHWFQSNMLTRKLMRSVYGNAERIICISENLAREVNEHLGTDAGKLMVIPSFLPVTESERNEKLSETIEAFCQRHNEIVSFNAFQPSVVNGVDLYGVDILLDAFADVRTTFPGAGLVLVFMRPLNSDYGEKIRKRVVGLGDAVCLLENSRESFIPILERSAVFVRATNNDGGPSLSVLEALSLGRWCVASDAVPRPAEALLFRNRDPHGLADQIAVALRRFNEGKMQPPVSFPSAADSIFELYRGLIGRG